LFSAENASETGLPRPVTGEGKDGKKGKRRERGKAEGEDAFPSGRFSVEVNESGWCIR